MVFYLPHPDALKSFIFVVKTVRPKNLSAPNALTSPPALSSIKIVMLLTLVNLTILNGNGSELSLKSSAVNSKDCVGGTSSASSKPRLHRFAKT